MNTINSSVSDSNVQPRADANFIRKALEAADPNVLRLALHQLTGDRRLTEMRVEKYQIWAGALFTYALAQEHHAEVRERALEYLLESPSANIPTIIWPSAVGKMNRTDAGTTPWRTPSPNSVALAITSGQRNANAASSMLL